MKVISGKYLLVAVLLSVASFAFGQEVVPGWMEEIIELINDETDLCERCTWSSPTFSRVTFNNQILYFLRYSCSPSQGVTRMYNLGGELIGECITNDGVSNCGFGNNANTIYTFSEIIIPIWSCTRGFDCLSAAANNIEQEVPIFIDDSRCTEGVKILRVDSDYASVIWEGPNVSEQSPSISVQESGIYSVTVVDPSGCEQTGSVAIDDLEELNVSIKGPQKICERGEVPLTIAQTFSSYRWSTGQSGPSILVNEPGSYQVTVTSEEDCIGMASFTMSTYPSIAPEIVSSETVIDEGEEIAVSISYEESISAIDSIEWIGEGEFSCRFCLESLFLPVSTGNISAYIQDSRGCTYSASALIEVMELPLNIFTPNIFTPKGAAENAVFSIYGGANAVQVKNLTILNRWGNIVFQKENFELNKPSEGWDGIFNNEFVQEDVYVYHTEVIFLNGKTKKFIGDVLVMY